MDHSVPLGGFSCSHWSEETPFVLAENPASGGEAKTFHPWMLQPFCMNHILSQNVFKSDSIKKIYIIVYV